MLVTVTFADPEPNKRERTLEEAAHIHFVDFMDECAGMLNHDLTTCDDVF